MTIEDAQHDASNAALEQIKYAAMAEVATAHEKISMADHETLKAQAGADEQMRKHAGAEEEAKRGASNPGTAEGEILTQVLGTILPGGETAKMVFDIMDSRLSDPAAFGGHQTMESIGKKAMQRAPGMYSNGADAGAKKNLWASLAGKGKAGETLSDINWSGDNLTKDAEGLARTAQMNATQISAQSRYVKDLTFSRGMASKQKYDKAHAIQMSRGGPSGPGGMGGSSHQAHRTLEHTLAMGPKGPSDDMLSDEETIAGALA